MAKATLVMGLAASALKRDRSSRDIAYTRKVPARRSRLLHGYVPLKSRDRIFLGVTAPQFSRHIAVENSTSSWKVVVWFAEETLSESRLIQAELRRWKGVGCAIPHLR